MKNRRRKQLYDELTTFIGRQTLNGALSPPESRLLLDYVDAIFFARIDGKLGQVLREWLDDDNDAECEELIFRRLLDTDIKDENSVYASETAIRELLDYYRNFK